MVHLSEVELCLLALLLLLEKAARCDPGPGGGRWQIWACLQIGDPQRLVFFRFQGKPPQQGPPAHPFGQLRMSSAGVKTSSLKVLSGVPLFPVWESKLAQWGGRPVPQNLRERKWHSDLRWVRGADTIGGTACFVATFCKPMVSAGDCEPSPLQVRAHTHIFATISDSLACPEVDNNCS